MLHKIVCIFQKKNISVQFRLSGLFFLTLVKTSLFLRKNKKVKADMILEKK